MYKVLKKENGDGTITVFYNPQFLNNPGKFQLPLSFIEIFSKDRVNYVVEDINSSNYSDIDIGNRVFVEETENAAVLGTVISNGSKSQHKLIVRLDYNSLDIVVEDKKVYLLPYQLNKHGKKIMVIDLFSRTFDEEMRNTIDLNMIRHYLRHRQEVSFVIASLELN